MSSAKENQAPVLAIAKISQDPSPALPPNLTTKECNAIANIVVLCNKYFNIFVHISLIFFLAQVTMLKKELKRAKESAAADANKKPANIKCPDKVTNLQSAMALMNDPGTYY